MKEAAALLVQMTKWCPFLLGILCLAQRDYAAACAYALIALFWQREACR